jgi:hypothetical protein
MTGISRRLLTNAIFDRLDTLLIGVTIYKGEVPEAPPLIQLPGGPDPSGRVAPYIVLYPSPGRPYDEEADLGDSNVDLDWQFQATVAAGYIDDLNETVASADDLLFRWSPVVAGAVVGRLRPPLGFDPGPTRRDKDFTPNRFFVPLLYQLTATT